MRALVLGGSGQTGALVARGLRARGVSVRTASRGAGAGDHVHFDWERSDTHDQALRDVDAVYLVAPGLVRDPASIMVRFVDRAIARGARRFVLLSASVIEEGSPGLGTVHAALRARAPAWAVLRPSWFMQNFFDPRHHLAQAIARDGILITATGRGRVGFIDVADIAAVAVETLLAPPNASLVLTGPEAMSYDDVARILSLATGRPIAHRAVSVNQARAWMVASGIPDSYARFLAELEHAIAGGIEDRTTAAVARTTGRQPRSLREIVDAWAGTRPGSATA